MVCNSPGAGVLSGGSSHPRLLLKSAMPQKPPNLIYAVDDNPPLGATLLLGLQHIFTLTMSFVLI
jgi:hypothetical protein